MGKVSKNSRVTRGTGANTSKNHVKIVVSEKDPKTGSYVYKEKMIHKDKLDEYIKNIQ
ncbi:MAG: DUF4295 family protein [Chitinophagales bacterium]